MIEIHIGSLIAGIIVGIFFGGWLMLTVTMKNWSEGYEQGTQAAKEIWWDFKKREAESKDT